MNNSVKKCVICNNEKCGEFITINDKKYHLCCIEQLQQENTQLKSVLKEIREKLKEHKYDLDYEPWGIYKIQGNILFDLVKIIDKGIGEDK